MTTTINNPKKSFKIKNKEEDIFNRIIKPEMPPRMEPKNSFKVLVLLFRAIDTHNNNMNSNKKLIKKT